MGEVAAEPRSPGHAFLDCGGVLLAPDLREALVGRGHGEWARKTVQEADARPIRKPLPPARVIITGGSGDSVRRGAPTPSAAQRCPEEPAHVLGGLAGPWPASSRGLRPG